MLTYKPKRHTKTAIGVVIFMLAVLVCIFAIGVLGIGNDLINQALIFTVVAGILYILMRYAIYEYTYTLSESELAVTRVAGRVPNTILRISLNADDSFIRVRDKKELKTLGVKKIENACANLSPRERMYAYITTVSDRKVAVLFESDELFALAVNERINMKKISDSLDESEEGDI